MVKRRPARPDESSAPCNAHVAVPCSSQTKWTEAISLQLRSRISIRDPRVLQAGHVCVCVLGVEFVVL